jgi:hypothetical protein
VDSNEAKTVLQAYRPGLPADDPRVAEALERTKRDPDLGKWWKEQCELHEALRAKFQEMLVPSDLKERILAGPRIVKPAVWWRSRATMAAAAAVVVLAIAASALFLQSGTGSEFRAYRRDMVQVVADLYKMNVRATTWDDLRRTLGKNGWPADFVLPDSLRAVRLEGGVMTYWREEKVSLACMKTAEGRDLWLFVINRTVLPAAPAAESPQFAGVGKLNTAAWSSGDKVYLLAISGDETELKKLL